MVKVITGLEIGRQANRICRSNKEFYLAVSYWSGGAAKALGLLPNDNARIVLDVESGGTSPEELTQLIEHLGENVHVHRDLHAKIYASKKRALVGSANATGPGLQLKPSDRVEAAMLLKDKQAVSAYKFARKLFKDSEVATEEHVEICRKRFAKKTVAEAELGKIKRLDLFSALIAYPELYGHLPVIVSDEEVDREERDDAWKEQRTSLEPNSSDADFDLKKWDDFGSQLPSQYQDQMCLALHIGSKGAVWGGLVRPFPQDDKDWTFARRVSWEELPGLKFKGLQNGPRGPVSIKPALGKDIMKKAIEQLAEQDNEVNYGRDFIAALHGVLKD